MSNVCVSGCGYVGLVAGACFAELGHTVVCVEADRARLDALQRGELPIQEPGLLGLVTRHRREGRLAFAADCARAVPQSEFAFLAVNTPAGPNGDADLTHVTAAVRSILEHASPGLIIAVKSTVPVGTADALAQLVVSTGRHRVEVVSNPEFLRQGVAVRDFLQPDRIVIGASSEEAGSAVAALYASLDAPIFVCSRRSAELAKYASNAFLAARVSLINELAAICEAVEADIGEVARIVGTDHRIGPACLNAGLGWGGSCLPKDVLALAATAAERGCDVSLLRAVFDVNVRQKERAIERLWGALGAGTKATVGVLGLAFKPDTDDVRGSPALDIIAHLLDQGAQVLAHDPLAMGNARRVLPRIRLCHDPYEVASGSDALLLATEWRDYLTLDWARMRRLMQGRVIVDGRNALDGRLLSEMGFNYIAFGMPAKFSANGHPPDRDGDRWPSDSVR